MKDEVAAEALVYGSDDWFPLWTVVMLAKNVGHARNGDDARRLALQTVRYLLEEGLVDAGELTDTGFRSWTAPPRLDLRRIEQTWQAGGDLQPGEGCWFSNTAKGDAEAEEIMRKKNI